MCQRHGSPAAFSVNCRCEDIFVNNTKCATSSPTNTKGIANMVCYHQQIRRYITARRPINRRTRPSKPSYGNLPTSISTKSYRLASQRTGHAQHMLSSHGSQAGRTCTAASPVNDCYADSSCTSIGLAKCDCAHGSIRLDVAGPTGTTNMLNQSGSGGRHTEYIVAGVTVERLHPGCRYAQCLGLPCRAQCITGSRRDSKYQCRHDAIFCLKEYCASMLSRSKDQAERCA